MGSPTDSDSFELIDFEYDYINKRAKLSFRIESNFELKKRDECGVVISSKVKKISQMVYKSLILNKENLDNLKTNPDYIISNKAFEILNCFESEKTYKNPYLPFWYIEEKQSRLKNNLILSLIDETSKYHEKLDILEQKENALKNDISYIMQSFNLKLLKNKLKYRLFPFFKEKEEKNKKQKLSEIKFKLKKIEEEEKKINAKILEKELLLEEKIKNFKKDNQLYEFKETTILFDDENRLIDIYNYPNLPKECAYYIRNASNGRYLIKTTNNLSFDLKREFDPFLKPKLRFMQENNLKIDFENLYYIKIFEKSVYNIKDFESKLIARFDPLRRGYIE